MASRRLQDNHTELIQENDSDAYFGEKGEEREEEEDELQEA
jgi:hypothetical protein